MGNLLLSPQGRINSAEFTRGGHLLILLTIGFGLAYLVSPTIGKILAVADIALMYMWAVLWIKRLHNGGKSGWMFFVYILLYIFISMIAVMVMLMFVPSEDLLELTFKRMNNDITDKAFQAEVEAWRLVNMLPIIITKSLASIITLYIGDKSIPTDAGDNKYGSGLG